LPPRHAIAFTWRRAPAALVAVGALVGTGCGLTETAAVTSPSTVAVVAVENFWGSIATQVGGDHARVASIIVNPATDPHDYEATPADARLLAGARYVILNGAGYDAWASKLLDANPLSGRTVLNAGDLVGAHAGDNPHLWYSPVYVDRVVTRIAQDLGALDHADSAYFRQRATEVETVALQRYHALISNIRARYAGAKVGATESVFSNMADALGLDLVTPAAYLRAVSEGTDPSAADKATVEAQVAGRRIRVLVFNAQNSTPEVQSVVAAARAERIPVVTITETLSPATASFQDWQTAQLESLLRALGG
jgi:zinc/manganese transport system substrate-binding protein